MTRVRYHLLDVFTDRPFTGNPLAVFVDPPELSATQMQALARELNLSETVFVHSAPRAAGTWPTRIFTPGSELPFAGHPTVGTAVLLAELGLIEGEVVLAEGVGDVRVTVERGTTTRATLRTTGPPQVTQTDEWSALANLLGIDTGDLHPKLAPAVWSCGVPVWIVPVRDADVLARTAINPVVWSDHFQHGLSDEVYVMAPLDDSLDRWRSRMYAPSLGIPEDPATGAAAAAAAGFLAGSRQLRAGPMEWVIEQGIEMGRPSEIRVALEQRGTEVTAVLVSGAAVIVGQGEMGLPGT